ncbi:hypothetical protein HZA86_04415 [Candidatus Uhrbacteria bacterium]|nr:hypothetical protein [Candidatus Uhrbacteria bacterium]
METHPRFPPGAIILHSIAALTVVVVTAGFIVRDLAWSGHWRITEQLGDRSTVLSAPWPTDRWQKNANGITLQNESVYVTARIPRPFNRVDVVLSADDTTPMSVGVETRPNTLTFRLVDCVPVGFGQCRASIPLDDVDQRSGRLNLVLRSPSVSNTHPVALGHIAVDFQRAPRTLPALLNALWSTLRSSG